MRNIGSVKDNAKEYKIMKWLFILRLIISMSLISANVTSDSMNGLLEKGDTVVALKDSFVWEYNRYDIVIFKSPVDDNELYIKRIIGLPGERVVIKNGQVYINASETPLEENYLPDKWIIDNDGYTFNVPQDSYLLLGDNRNDSEDARYWGEIAVEKGKAQDINTAEQYRYVKIKDIYAKMLFKIFL